MAELHNKRAGLIQEHEAIRAQMGLLLASLADSAQQWTSEKAQATLLKDQIRGYRWAMHDLQDGIRRHIELDEHIIKMLPLSSAAESLLDEHEEIWREVDCAVRLADDAVENELNQEELGEHRFALSEAVSRIRVLIESHTAKEDTLFRPL